MGIFKELIQNADDAGATTVKFLVDWRKGRTGSLFSPGMAECQGPALWAYNNAVFADEDFENINKLAGETKVEDISKIGRFGLGFNAVYHLTDVPSFISREHLVVFDPNIHHLQRHIKDRSRPGIHINLAEKPESFARYHDQFQPYNGVFDCNTMQTRGGFYYDGTLFRFPFRTATQASTSDIIRTAYSQDRIQSIVSSLCECASTLLIFSQHVKKVEVYELGESCQPDEKRLVLSVNKPTVQAFRRQRVNNEEPFIKQCSKWWRTYRESQMSSTEFPSGCELINIVTTKEPSELSGRDRRHSSDLKWFVVSASGTDASLTIARSPEGRDRGFLPCGGAAFVVQRVPEQGSSESVVTSDLSGELFCFLPLSIRTGLPVHVNGYFAIMSNRVEIWKRTMMGTQPIEVEWNEALMEDALARAYIMLLENMKESTGNVQDYKFYSLWPSNDTVDMQSWKKLVQKICSVLLDQQSKLFYSDGVWMSINDGFLLSDDFDEIYGTAVEVLRSLGIHVFDLPNNILQTLIKFDRWGILKRRTLTFAKLVKQYFFPKIRTVTSTHRDAIVCFGLDRILKENEPSLCSLFKQNTYIAVSQDGETLKKPSELIHPFGPASELFAREDHRFPMGNGLRDANRLYVLETLGMVKNLDWAGILERAKIVANGGFPPKTELSRKLIKYLNKQIDELPKSAHYHRLLQQIKFLPVETKPQSDYLLPWAGSRCFWTRFRAPNDVFLPNDAKLVGASCFIINTSEKSGCGKLNDDMKNLLGFLSRRPSHTLVIQQLDEAIKFWTKLSDEEKQETKKRLAIESIMQGIYGFVNEGVEKARDRRFLNELGKRDWLFLQGKFVQSRKVAYTSKGNGVPFLFTLPSEYQKDYGHLLEAMQIKQLFDSKDYIDALYELESTKKGMSLTEDELQVAIFFTTQIDVENPTAKNYIGKIPLPDTKSILHRSEEVVVNLSLWLEDTDDNPKVHEKIPPQTAHALGARSLKSVVLKKCSHRIDYGESFGQQEDLTDRLKGILDGYPDDGILKELVQNADDAQASEIHFIHDTRTLGSENVATDDASEEIQGPALCVYNDRPFTKEDLEGIKKLGIGSKRDSLAMTGKYGIGFNSVYHLTDCPSFLSNNDTLAFLDPHCRYFVDDDRGRLFKLKSMNEETWNKLSDTLDGYLADHFNLQGSTVFRFPLRRKENESKISSISPNMEKLLLTFQKEARKSLLFLNHVKKITISKIDPNGKFEEIYQVETVITPENENKRQEMARKICELKDTPTAEIGWEGASYTLTVKENQKEDEVWLIQQCIGSVTATLSTSDGKKCEIPDGRELGALPRGGLAARLWTNSCLPEEQEPLHGIVYCFLPLPEKYTNLPVHVNGNFALDNQRRRLWTDTDGKGEKSKWNDFMNTCVLPPAYAALITEARDHLCNDEGDNQLSRYHALFPKVLSDCPWLTLTTELYRYLGQTRATVLPLLVPTESENELSASTLKQNSNSGLSTLREEDPGTVDTSEQPEPVHVTCTEWLSADQAYFKESSFEDIFSHLLIRIGVPVLLHAPYLIYESFQSAGIISHEVTSKSVIEFLRLGTNCKIGNLPKKLETTAIKCVSDLSTLIEYCCECQDFGKRLAGMPLLLTQDGYLKIFDSRQPVFCSKFGNLFPTQLHLFVHSDIVEKFQGIATESESIIREFTVRDISRLLSHIFTDKVLRDIEDDTTWKFPAEGTLSESWFNEFWDLLQNWTKPEPSEDFVFLECLSEWPVIPTTCGKLVKIRDAKFVLDMTVIGNESEAQQNVCTFLAKLKCPVLNKEITFKDKKSSYATGTVHTAKDEPTTKKPGKSLERAPAVTDAYVGHPHDVIDVLVVVNHMLTTDRLDLAGMREKEIRKFLQFVQDNYKGSGLLEEYRHIVKRLPFHKALNGQFVSLVSQYSSCALISSVVPMKQLDALQERANCRFLNADVLPALEELYRDLGVRKCQDVTQFYVDYVFKHFSLFTRESQMQHLVNIKDQVHPSLSLGASVQKEAFLKSMAQTHCIPDKNGCLHKASEFFNPKKKVFKVMFKDDCNKFPPSPFDDEDWLDLLEGTGLIMDITPQLFLKFCTTVAENGKRSPSNPQCRVQSEKLVKCLFTEKSLKEEKCLQFQVSQIKFIAPAKVEEELTSIYKQYQCSRNGYPPFIQFKNAVPWRFRFETWTSAPILPIWTQPNNMAKWKNLGIAWSGPTYTDVLDHLENVVTSCSPDSIGSDYLHKMITKPIYQFLWEKTMECSGSSPNDGCSDVCMNIGDRLKNVSCIFLEEDKIFVKGEQLVFKLPDKWDLKPFLYPVPRQLADLEHFLKRLGATEKPTASQAVYVLDSIHEEVGEEVLSPEQEKKVKCAMHVLFELLCNGESAEGIDELYLPSQEKKLARSCEMVCKVSSRYTNLIENLQRPILLLFKECGLKKAADDYIDALPEHLRPKKFDELFREDVAPESKSSICIEAQHGSICNFERRYENLLGSDEFQEGLKRLLIHDRQDPQESEQRIKKLQTELQIKCAGVKNIKISLIDRNTNEVMANLEESCYAVQEEGAWTLYIQHEFKDDLVLIACCVDKILDDSIHQIKGLIRMLGCSSPSEISSKLNGLGIPHVLSTTAHELFSGCDSSDEIETRSGQVKHVGFHDGGYGVGGSGHSSGYGGGSGGQSR